MKLILDLRFFEFQTSVPTTPEAAYVAVPNPKFTYLCIMFSRKGNPVRQIAGKVTLLLLVSIYLFFSIGVIKATHFCMGREASVAFFDTEAKKCACSLYAAEKDSCCNDEHELLRLENEQKVISTFSLPLPRLFILEELYTKQLTDPATADTFRPGDWPKEQPLKIPRWKINCSLVFYDDEPIA